MVFYLLIHAGVQSQKAFCVFGSSLLDGWPVAQILCPYLDIPIYTLLGTYGLQGARLEVKTDSRGPIGLFLHLRIPVL